MTDLQSSGFSVIDGPFSADDVSAVSNGYDEMFASLPEARIKRGSTSIRFGGLTQWQWFLPIILYPPLLALAQQYIGGPFKLSSFHGRTLLPTTTAPPLHQDVKPGSDGDPLMGFIYMVDAFTATNGATRFAPGSRHLAQLADDSPEYPACGPAGSFLVFDGATWHEHGANQTPATRRSIQGYFIRQDHTAAVRWADEIPESQARRLSAQARDVLAI